MLKTFLKNENGQGMVEYVLIIALIALLVVGGLAVLKTGLQLKYNDISNKI